MNNASGQYVVALNIMASWVLLVLCPCALALDPALDVSQYAHTSWKIREGFSKGPIGAIAQTPDGYLWLGSDFGLLRFDGVRNVRWQPPTGQKLPSSNISNLLAARDGRLWIGTERGLASWKGGKLTLHPEFDGQVIGKILEDRDGTVWAGTRYPPPGRLCAFRNDSVQIYGEEGEFGNRASSLFEDHAGNLWVGSDTGLWRWKPDPPKFYPLSDFESSYGLTEIGNNALLIAVRKGLKQLVDEKVADHSLSVDGLRFQPSCLLRDRDGGLWIGTFDRGLVHVYQEKVDLFSQSNGLSGNYIRTLFEDREGNIWVATTNGLDRFCRFAAVTLSVPQGLSEAMCWSILAASEGSVWVGTPNGLNRLRDGQVTIYRTRSIEGATKQLDTAWKVREIIDEGLPDDVIHSLFEDYVGRIWVSTRSGVAYFEDEKFISVSGIPKGVHSITGDATNNIWISEDQSLLHLQGGSLIKRIPWVKLGRETPAIPMLFDPVQGGLWLGFRDGTGLAYYKEGQILTSYTSADGLGQGKVSGLQLDADGTLWIATEGGLGRIKGDRVDTLTEKNGLPSNNVQWVIEDNNKSFWLYTASGLVRINRLDIEEWIAAVEKNKDTNPKLQVTVYDNSAGVMVRSAPAFNPQVGKSSDGRLWFLPGDGVSVIDPLHLPYNQLSPLVHIEQITADGKIYNASAGLRLPPLVRDLSIDYTALSFVAPETIHFRYKLEGQDTDWKEVINERRAQYSNLAPGLYRFRVTACNNSGVWNEEGESLDFVIAPAYYQTNSFRALCVAVFIALLGGLYQWRIHQVQRREKQFRTVIERIPTMAFSVHPDGTPELVNQRWLDYVGLSAVETKNGHGWETTIHPDDIEFHLKKWNASLAIGVPFENEARHRSASGEYRWFLIRVVPFRDKQGNIIKWYGTQTDIEDRKRAEETLRRLNRELNAISNCGQVLMRATDEEQLINEVCNIICTNAGYRLAWVGYAENDEEKTVRPVAWSGYDSEYVINAKISWSEDTEWGQGPAGKVIRCGETIYIQDFETDSQIAPWRESALQRGYRSGIALPLKDESENVFGALLIYSTEMNAITPDEIHLMEELAGDLAFGIISLRNREKRKRAEEEIRQSVERKTILNDIANIFLTIPDEEMFREVLLVVLRVFNSPFGYFGFMGDTGDLIIPTLTKDIWEDCQIPDKTFVFPPDSWGNSIWGKAIRERKTYASKGPFHTPLGHLQINNFITSPIVFNEKTIGLISLANKNEGYTEEDKKFLEEMTFFISPILNARMQRDRQEKKRKFAEDALRKLSYAVEQSPASIVITDKNGDIVYVNPKFSEITGYSQMEVLGKNPRVLKSGEHPQEIYRKLWETITSGKEWRGEFHNRKKNGELFWESASISPIINSKGVITHYVAVKEDITERKLLEEQFLQAQKMEAVGRLAGGIAHDFNNMIGAILGFSDISLNRLNKNDPIYDHILSIKECANRSANLTRQLLAFSRKQILIPEVVNLNEIIENFKKVLIRLIGEDIELHIVASPSLNSIKADRGQIEQIIMNLVVNARDAMPEGGRLTIETSDVYLEDQYAQAHANITIGHYVMMAISDTGCGMDEKTKSQIFEPFFTTKEKDKGTGLGLASVYGIVKQSGGNIWIDSELDKGTTFKIYFPQVEGIQRKAKEIQDSVAIGKGETILIAEDEDALRDLIVRVLENAQYNVIAARNAGEALLISEQLSVRIDLLITDMIMPLMDGRKLADRLLQTRQELKVLFMSGYTDNSIIHQSVLDADTNFMQKPFSPLNLLEKVKELLN